MNETFCIACDRKEDCREPCTELEVHLFQEFVHPLSGENPLSTDYMDKVFKGREREENPLELERQQRKARKKRGKAVNKLVAYFAEITGEEGKSLKYFLIWKMKVEEQLKDREIAEIIGFSRQRISQILGEIKADIGQTY
jgi:hypothetical protein